jgi:hypothetical protein
MGVLVGIVTVLFLIYLLLRIFGMLGVSKPVVTVQQVQNSGPQEKFDPTHFNTAHLPQRTAEEIHQIQDSMSIEWVVYSGATPPLRLRVSGQTYESYRRIVRKHIDEIGQENMERLSPELLNSFNNAIIADAYVVDWEGAQYPNGNAMPYSTENLSVLLARDPYLLNFLTTEARRISPPWPTS